MSSCSTGLRVSFTVGAILLIAPPVPAQRVVPPPPAGYDAQIRYRIQAGRTEHINQFLGMSRYLESLGFRQAPGADPNQAADPAAERLIGTLPSSAVRAVLRWPTIRTVLLVPQGYKLPEDAQQRIPVQLELATASSPTRQRDLRFQTLDRLIGLGFVEKVGYDTQGHTRVLGTIPTGGLNALVKDIRPQPVRQPPDPIASIDPLRIIEVLPEVEGVPPSVDVPPPPLPPAGQEFLAKIAPELREPASAEGPNLIRLEVVLTRTPGPDDTAWRGLFLSRPGVTIEGRLGQVVTVLAPPSAIRDWAAYPEVATLRLPRAATGQPAPAPSGRSVAPFAATGLDHLHQLNYRGSGIRVAVIDTDFNGAQERLGKDLPRDTVFIDLTAARNRTLLPDPAAESGDVGRGTQMALAVRLAAPEAGLVLIRVDPAAAYQVLTAARYMHGEAIRPDDLENRNRELLADGERLIFERSQLTDERRVMASDFSQDEGAVQRRRALAERTADLARREQDYFGRLDRFAQLEQALTGLRGVRIVVSSLAWDIGYPTDGSGPLTRYLDDQFFGRPPTHVVGSLAPRDWPTPWFQAAGNTRGQVWNGPLYDADGNGAFAFAPPQVPLPAGRWTREVNFLAWQPAGAERAADLPTGARVRLALQWTEAHDAMAGEVPGPDPYRVPIADVRLLVLRQRDPSGTRAASDDFNLIARSESLPQMIDRTPNSATYEHIVEFTLDAPGRIAVRLEGAVPLTTRPASFPTLPELNRTWEPRARIFAEVTDAATSGQGRVVFGDFQPGLGGLGTPGDALIPRTVGAADARGTPQPYSAYGSPAGRELVMKPRFLAFDELPLPGVAPSAGTDLAAAFAGGIMASMMSAGTIESAELNWLGLPPYGLFRVPSAWLEQVEQRWPRTGRDRWK